MKKRYKPQYKTEQVYKESVEYSQMSLKDFINNLHRINKDAKKKGFRDLTVEFEKEWGYYDDQWTNMIIKGKKVEKHVSEHLH